MLTKSLYLSSIRFLTKNIWQFASLITGIVLSVAIITATDLAIDSAKKSFQLSNEIINGKATHHIVNNSGKIKEELIVTLENKYKITVTPVIEGFVTKNKRLLKVIGIDPFSDAEFRDIFREFNSIKQYNPAAFINKLEGFFVTKHTADKFKILPGDPFLISRTDDEYSLKLYGILDSNDKPASTSLDNLLFMDISTAQELLNLQNYVSRIDLIINPEDESELKNILFAIDPSLVLIQASEAKQSKEAMTRAFNANLSALSLLAMLVGVFLIYNTMTFAVLQRRKIFGFLRALGINQKEIFTLILFESLVFGILGAIIGLGLGYLLASLILSFIVRTINDLYFALQVTQLNISNIIFLKAAFIGIFAAVMSALLPAYEASKSPVARVIKNIDLEETVKKYLPRLNLAACVLITSSLIIFTAFEKNIAASFLGLFLMVIGFSCFIPFLTYHCDYVLSPIYKTIFGLNALVALRSLKKNLSRNAVAISALTVAISLYLSLDIAISSFRATVDDWLSASLLADVYIAAPKQVSHRNNIVLDNHVIKLTKNFKKDEVEGISEYHLRDLISENINARVVSINSIPEVKNAFRFKEVMATGVRQQSLNALWANFNKGLGVFVSSPYAYKHKVKPGDKVKLHTDEGLYQFPILAIFNDYSSDQGIIMMHQSLYRSLWEDDNLTSLGIFLKKSDKDNLSIIPKYIEAYKAEAAKEDLSPLSFEIRSNQNLKKESLEIFDRTFKVTSVLKFIAILVAAFGIFSALLSLIIEREKEFALLKAIGLSKSEIKNSVMLQAFTMGLLASVFALPLGAAAAWVMVFVINYRSFGWDMNFALNPKSFLFAALVSVLAALIAAVAPSSTQVKVSPRELEKEEAF